MNNRKEMIDFALTRMSGFTLEKSSESDNRSIFGLVKSLIQSASGKTLIECRKPLVVVLNMRDHNQKTRFMGCKLALLQQTIKALFGDPNSLLTEREFAEFNRDKLLDFLEISRRIFIAQYAVTASVAVKASVTGLKYETAIEKAFRIAQERSKRS